jgi:DNA-binding transcriptional MerR regulator
MPTTKSTAETSIDIGEVAKRSGLPTSTLRYYEEQGLIQSIGRHGLRRQYSDSVLQRLALISLGRNAGFSLQEIGDMFTPQSVNIDRELLQEKSEELDEQIKRLTTMRDGLRHAAKCPAPSHLECPKFQRILRIAAKKPRSS